jgi:hypothetical protein
MNALKTRLKDFKLSGILLSLDERLKYANDKSLAYVELLDLLFEDEAHSRRDNTSDYIEQNFHQIKLLKDLILHLNHLSIRKK